MAEWLNAVTDNYVLVTEGSLLDTGLIVGSERAMVIGTGSGPRQGREILHAVRSIREDHGQHHDHGSPPVNPGHPQRRQQSHSRPALRAGTVMLVHNAFSGGPRGCPPHAF